MEEKLEKLKGLIEIKKLYLEDLKEELTTMELIKSTKFNKLTGEIAALMYVYNLFEGE